MSMRLAEKVCRYRRDHVRGSRSWSRSANDRFGDRPLRDPATDLAQPTACRASELRCRYW